MDLLQNIQLLIAVVASMGIGAVWYSPVLFGDAWARMSGIDLADPQTEDRMRKEAPKLYLWTFMSVLIMATLLDTFMTLLKVANWYAGVLLAFAFWVGFVATTSYVNYAFSNRSMKLWMIDSGFHLTTLIVIAIILTL